MIRISVLYPNQDGVTFDHNYYETHHRGLVEDRWKPLGLKRVEMDRGVAGFGGADAPFVACGYLFFDSSESFQSAFEAHGDELLEDIPNFTNVQPTIQISQVAVS